jgi:hypothetical protein
MPNTLTGGVASVRFSLAVIVTGWPALWIVWKYPNVSAAPRRDQNAPLWGRPDPHVPTDGRGRFRVTICGHCADRQINIHDRDRFNGATDGNCYRSTGNPEAQDVRDWQGCDDTDSSSFGPCFLTRDDSHSQPNAECCKCDAN